MSVVVPAGTTGRSPVLLVARKVIPAVTDAGLL